MKYFTEEITVLKSGQVAVAINEKASEKEALSACYLALGSATANPDVVSIHVEAKNDVGGIYENKTWISE